MPVVIPKASLPEGIRLFGPMAVPANAGRVTIELDHDGLPIRGSSEGGRSMADSLFIEEARV